MVAAEYTITHYNRIKLTIESQEKTVYPLKSLSKLTQTRLLNAARRCRYTRSKSRIFIRTIYFCCSACRNLIFTTIRLQNYSDYHKERARASYQLERLFGNSFCSPRTSVEV